VSALGQHVLVFVDEAAGEVRLLPVHTIAVLRASSKNQVAAKETGQDFARSGADAASSSRIETPSQVSDEHAGTGPVDEQDARGALVAAFGSKRQKRSRSVAIARRITADSVQATETALQQTAAQDGPPADNQTPLTREHTLRPTGDVNGAVPSSMPTSVTEALTESIHLVPRFDAKATTAESAYPLLDGCLPSRFFSMYKASTAELEELWKHMKYANRMKLQSPLGSEVTPASSESSDPSPALLRQCTMLYLHILLECYHRWPRHIAALFEGENALKTEPSPQSEAVAWLPDWLQRFLLERFSQDDSTNNKRVVEKERMLHHILVLYLHLFGFIDQPIDALADALRLPPARCATYFKYIGLSVRRLRQSQMGASSGTRQSGLLVSLDRLPLQFPPAVRRQRLL
jgi:hypothetical protein